MRYVGWTIFLVGLGLFVTLGDLTVTTLDGKIGIAIMLLGMIVTSVSTVLGNFRQLREQRSRMAELRDKREGPPHDPTP